MCGKPLYSISLSWFSKSFFHERLKNEFLAFPDLFLPSLSAGRSSFPGATASETCATCVTTPSPGSSPSGSSTHLHPQHGAHDPGLARDLSRLLWPSWRRRGRGRRVPGAVHARRRVRPRRGLLALPATRLNALWRRSASWRRGGVLRCGHPQPAGAPRLLLHPHRRTRTPAPGARHDGRRRRAGSHAGERRGRRVPAGIPHGGLFPTGDNFVFPSLAMVNAERNICWLIFYQGSGRLVSPTRLNRSVSQQGGHQLQRTASTPQTPGGGAMPSQAGVSTPSRGGFLTPTAGPLRTPSDKPSAGGGPPTTGLFSAPRAVNGGTPKYGTPGSRLNSTPMPSTPQLSFGGTPVGANASLREEIFNASTAASSDLNTWITVFGFPPSASSYILSQFSQYGTILQHHIPANGNWMHLRYQTK